MLLDPRVYVLLDPRVHGDDKKERRREPDWDGVCFDDMGHGLDAGWAPGAHHARAFTT
jgi:hypothetical protein